MGLVSLVRHGYRDEKLTKADSRYDSDRVIPPCSVFLRSATKNLNLKYPNGEGLYYEYTTKVPNDGA